MADTHTWTVEFMREEALQLAAPYNPASEPWSALVRAADALAEASRAIRRHQARDGRLVPVIGVVDADGQVRLYDRPAPAADLGR